MTQQVGLAVLGFLIQFVVATVVLWGISIPTKSPNATLKTAAIWVAIMATMWLIFIAVFSGIKMNLATGPIAMLISLLLFTVFPVYLLMRLYKFRLLLAIGVFIAMYVAHWVIDTALSYLK